MYKLIMLCGVPGSGKTTWSYNKYGNEKHAYIASDHFIEAIAEELGKTYSEVFQDVIKYADTKFFNDLGIFTYLKDAIVLIDRTNLTVKSRARVLKEVNNADLYYKEAIYFDTPIEIVKERLTERNKSGKIISDELLDRMIKSTQIPTEDEGFDKVTIIK